MHLQAALMPISLLVSLSGNSQLWALSGILICFIDGDHSVTQSFSPGLPSAIHFTVHWIRTAKDPDDSGWRMLRSLWNFAGFNLMLTVESLNQCSAVQQADFENAVYEFSCSMGCKLGICQVVELVRSLLSASYFTAKWAHGLDLWHRPGFQIESHHEDSETRLFCWDKAMMRSNSLKWVLDQFSISKKFLSMSVESILKVWHRASWKPNNELTGFNITCLYFEHILRHLIWHKPVCWYIIASGRFALFWAKIVMYDTPIMCQDTVDARDFYTISFRLNGSLAQYQVRHKWRRMSLSSKSFAIFINHLSAIWYNNRF